MTKPSLHILPTDYTPSLDLYQTQLAIKAAKDIFERKLAKALDLQRVSAPLFVDKLTGLNDDLNGVERPVQFDLLEQPGVCIQVVQSLAKWKRYALGRYGFPVGKGLYTDMNAIRRDEITDNLHSIYVDQWDWEKVITKQMRNEETLHETVRAIHGAIYETAALLKKEFPALTVEIPEEIHFITTQELEDRWPDLSPAQREQAFIQEHGAAFFQQIGWPLRSGVRHDGRAPDYDDWSLNGDIVYFHRPLGCRFEVSSMGIRVDAEAMRTQLKAAGCEERAALPFHSALLSGQLPQTMGGGIGQSRLCMLLLGKAHIGEVQCAVWPPEAVERFASHGVSLL